MGWAALLSNFKVTGYRIRGAASKCTLLFTGKSCQFIGAPDCRPSAPARHDAYWSLITTLLNLKKYLLARLLFQSALVVLSLLQGHVRSQVVSVKLALLSPTLSFVFGLLVKLPQQSVVGLSPLFGLVLLNPVNDFLVFFWAVVRLKELRLETFVFLSFFCVPFHLRIQEVLVA